MLSFNKGKPFCILRGGKKDGKILMIHDNVDKESNYKYNDKKLKKLHNYQLEQLKDALTTDDDKYLNGKTKNIYNKIKNNGDLGKHYKMDDSMFKIYPTQDKDQRDSIYITGPSGSGKSTFISQFIEEYIKLYPKRPVVLFSNKFQDKALDKFRPMRIPLNFDLVEDPIELEELEKSLVIFDDIDQITNKQIREAVFNLRDRILEEGRSKGISICTVAHQITNYKESRICLNEADYVVFFCKSGAKYQINYFLKNYGGLDKEQIDTVMNLPSRAVVLHKRYPMCVIYQNGCMVL